MEFGHIHYADCSGTILSELRKGFFRRVNLAALENYLQTLDLLRKRKDMYLTSVTLENTENYLAGFMGAVLNSLLLQSYPRDIITAVGNEFGYPECSSGPIFHIRNSTLSEEAKCDELIRIYAETVTRLFSAEKRDRAV